VSVSIKQNRNRSPKCFDPLNIHHQEKIYTRAVRKVSSHFEYL